MERKSTQAEHGPQMRSQMVEEAAEAWLLPQLVRPLFLTFQTEEAQEACNRNETWRGGA